jgi:hypothetical protein
MVRRRFVYRRGDAMNQSIDQQIRMPKMYINHRETINHKGSMETPRFFSRGLRACRHASPRCVDQHFLVRRLIGTHNRALQE